MKTQNLEHLNTIKGTAVNRNKARIWVESSKLPAYGFTRHAPITIRYHNDSITVQLDNAGDRVVAGRVRNGKAISILDICPTLEEREELFHGAAELEVHIAQGFILITAK